MAVKALRVHILSLSGTVFDGDASEVMLSTASGDLTLLADHTPLTSIVKPGMLRVVSHTGNEQAFVTFGGVLDIDGKTARILSDEVEHEDSLIEHEIEAALAEARKLVAEATDKHELAKAQAMVDRQAVRLGVAQLRRHRKQ